MSAIAKTKHQLASKAPPIQTRLHLDEAIHPQKQIPEVARAESVKLFRQLIEAVLASAKRHTGGRNE